MSIRTLPTTLLQIFYKIILYFQVIVKSVICPDNNFSRIFKHYWVKPEFWESDRLRLSSCVGKKTVGRQAVMRVYRDDDDVYMQPDQAKAGNVLNTLCTHTNTLTHSRATSATKYIVIPAAAACAKQSFL